MSHICWYRCRHFLRCRRRHRWSFCTFCARFSLFCSLILFLSSFYRVVELLLDFIYAQTPHLPYKLHLTQYCSLALSPTTTDFLLFLTHFLYLYTKCGPPFYSMCVCVFCLNRILFKQVLKYNFKDGLFKDGLGNHAHAHIYTWMSSLFLFSSVSIQVRKRKNHLK